MSVFSDFQRLWMQRFPHSSLSDAWELDVRASLERHKLKITELKKELEQETLYVEYLERLLSDVEKCKEDGTDPTKLFEAATASQQHAGSGSAAGQQNFLESPLGDAVSTTGTTGVINSPGTTGITSAIGGIGGITAADVIGLHDSKLNGPSNNKQVEENVTFRKTSQTSPVKRDSNKYSSFNPLNGSKSTSQMPSTTATTSSSNNYKTDATDDHREDKDAGTEKDYKNIQFQKNGALNQCITELASGFQSNDLNASTKNNETNRHSNGDINNSNSNSNSNSNHNKNNSNNNNNNNNNNISNISNKHNNNNGTNIDDNRSENNKPSHFVTVIEVKESKMPQTDESSGTPEKQSQHAATLTSTSTSSSTLTTTTTTIDLQAQEKNTVTTSSSSSSSLGTSTTLSSSSTITSDVMPVNCNSVSPGSKRNVNNKNSNNSNSVSSGNGGGGNRVPSQDRDRERHSSESEAVLSSFERKTKYEPTAPPMSPSMSASTSSAIPSSTSSSISSNLEVKKKVPPRPPPKLIRRVEPPTIPAGNIPLSSSPKRDLSGYGNTNGGCGGGGGGSSSNDSPSSSLERNIRPSDILRQKSSESLDAKNFISNRKTTPEMGKFGKSTDLAEEFGRKVGKSDSLEKTKRNADGCSSGGLIAVNQSPTGSLGKSASSLGISPTGSLSKFSQARHGTDSPPTGSLEKMKSTMITTSGKQQTESSMQSIGSKESLASQGNISEIIKSYESISSLSSDSTKAGGGGNGNGNGGNHIDNEPYYDTVPMDNGDGEYVYIKPGGTGSTSSRDDLSTAGSTLPMPPAHATNRGYMTSQTNVLEPESPGRSSNYVNIDYFLHPSTETRSSSLDSDGELDAPLIMRTISHDEPTSQTPGALRKVSGSLRGSKIRSILNSIIQSESIYVECLNKMIQYKKAIHSTLSTSQPVIREEEENTIFFKIEELHAAHMSFLNDLRSKVQHEGGDILVGDAFKRLADIIDLYSAFLHNYGQAIETVKKCSANSIQFKNTVSTIVLKLQNEQSLTLEDLLHKPVARVQINALVFNDLLNETPANHPDHQTLRQAQKTIHVFLKQFNVVNQRLPTESNKNLRRMVKSSFIVELVDGHRKLRHLFLFNDVIACAKYKASGRDRFELELKWFIPLKDVYIAGEDSMTDTKESSPANILQLKSQACTVRDQILLEEKDDKKTKANGMRVGDKHRRKLADLEGQLVLASPNLVFKIGNKQTNKTISFFLSSDFERTQWIESILTLQQSCNIPGANTINALEIQAFVFAMQNRIKTEMGSYLMRNKNDESLLVGDLHITVQGLTGLDHPADLYICIEVDTYGHYFRKAKTKMVCSSSCPLWNESFVLELEGSQNVRLLLYEAHDMPILRAKHVLKLSRSWLQEAPMNKQIKLNESILLTTTIRFVPGEVTLRRVPTSKPGALFGAKMSQVLKREKRDIPFILSACIREVERRGMAEVGIYRVSGSASDLAKLRKSFETNAYEAEQLLKEVDIHSVTGILKSYLRDLPEALFTDLLYPKLFETFNQFSSISEIARMKALMAVFEELPQANKASVLHILDHLIRVHQQETENKMSLHNLAMVFGPTLLRPGQIQTKQKDLLASSTVDVMAQAGILYCFLQARIRKD